MKKIYYPLEEQLEDIAETYGLNFSGIAIEEAEKIASKYVEWIENEKYIQFIPVDKITKQPIKE